MKAIKFKNEIVILDNAHKIELVNLGTGAKSNPNQYVINIYLNNNTFDTLKVGENAKEAEMVMTDIFNILREN
jgi:outer membrane usher protein FimD/PapC